MSFSRIMIVPLFVGREKSIRALEAVMAEDKQIILVTQKEADTEDPHADGLYTIGTVGSILQLLKLPDGAVKVLVEGGERVAYSSLVLTLGAELIRPPMGGDAADEVMGVNDLDDYRRFRDTLSATGGSKVAVIGAGLIGCEFTNDLLNGGYTVEAVDPMNYCLPTLLPETAGRAVQSALEEKGATFHFGPLATDVNKQLMATALYSTTAKPLKPI